MYPQREAMKKTLKLFIWRGVLIDYTPGIAFAMAHTADEAREKIIETAKKDGVADWVTDDIKAEPEVHATPFGVYVFGGAQLWTKKQKANIV